MHSIRKYELLSDLKSIRLTSHAGDTLDIKCPIHKFEASVKMYKGGELIQSAFPYLNATQREFMISGLTPEEQDTVFK